MNKDEILKTAQQENKGKDVADIEAQHRGGYLAYFVGLALIIIVDIVEVSVSGKLSISGNMVIFAMLFTLFITKYVTQRKKHELFVALLYGAGVIFWLFLWIMQLCGRIG